MINVVLIQRAEQDRNEISFYLCKELPAGTDDEVKAAFRIIQAELARADRADPLRRLPESARFPFVIMFSAVPERHYHSIASGTRITPEHH
jgi:hypothetical protein